VQSVVPEMEESGAQLLLVLDLGGDWVKIRNTVAWGTGSVGRVPLHKCEDLSSNPQNSYRSCVLLWCYSFFIYLFIFKDLFILCM
jgi:hypothetical protein